MRGLASGMDARIGAPGTGDGRWRPDKSFGGSLKRGLHRGAIILPLPANKGGAIIFNCDQNPLRHNLWSACLCGKKLAAGQFLPIQKIRH